MDMIREMAALLAAGALTAAAPQAAPPAPMKVAPAPAQPWGSPVIYTVEELRTGPLPLPILHELEPLHTLTEIEGVLKAHRLPFAWAIGEVRSATLPTSIITAIEKGPPHEPLVVPNAQATVIAVVLSKRPDTGPPPAAPGAAPGFSPAPGLVPR